MYIHTYIHTYTSTDPSAGWGIEVAGSPRLDVFGVSTTTTITTATTTTITITITIISSIVTIIVNTTNTTIHKGCRIPASRRVWCLRVSIVQ